MKLWKDGKTMEKKVYLLPKELDEEVARLHLEQLGAKLTKLIDEAGRSTSASRPKGRSRGRCIGIN